MKTHDHVYTFHCTLIEIGITFKHHMVQMNLAIFQGVSDNKYATRDIPFTTTKLLI